MTAARTHRLRDAWVDVRRSFVDFLAVPTATVLAFLLLALAMYTLDRQPMAWLEPTRQVLRVHFGICSVYIPGGPFRLDVHRFAGSV